MKTVSLTCAKSPTFLLDFTTPKRSLHVKDKKKKSLMDHNILEHYAVLDDWYCNIHNLSLSSLQSAATQSLLLAKGIQQANEIH